MKRWRTMQRLTPGSPAAREGLGLLGIPQSKTGAPGARELAAKPTQSHAEKQPLPAWQVDALFFDSARAAEMAKLHDPIILVRPETSTEDIAGFAVAAGILTG